MLIKGTDSIFLIRLKDGTTPVNITGAAITVLIKRSATDIIELPATITDALTGSVQCPIPNTALNRTGTYEFQVRINRQDNKVNTSSTNEFYVGEAFEKTV